MPVEGKVAVITGSTSGIGLGIAHELAKSGANIVVNSFSDTPEDHAVAQQIADDHGVKAIYIAADMASAADCRALIARANEQMGSVDILVPNAGIQHVAPIPEFAPEMWDKLIAIILNSTFHTTAAALPLMRKAGWGRIVIISSAHGLRASPYKSAYVSAKHGQIGFAKTCALETAEEPITCNAICPGYVLTPLVEAQIPDTMKQYDMDRETVIREILLARQPSKDFATVEQIGQIVGFLCSPAAEQITGTTISVDGGWTAV